MRKTYNTSKWLSRPLFHLPACLLTHPPVIHLARSPVYLFLFRPPAHRDTSPPTHLTIYRPWLPSWLNRYSLSILVQQFERLWVWLPLLTCQFSLRFTSQPIMLSPYYVTWNKKLVRLSVLKLWPIVETSVMSENDGISVRQTSSIHYKCGDTS